VVVVDDGARAGSENLLPSDIVWVPGPKPFVYARNVNLGMAACPARDAVVMGDDVEVVTPGGFDRLADRLRAEPALAILSAAIRGVVGNRRQQELPDVSLRLEHDWLAFVCVAIRREAWERLGTLDERFAGYGSEDVDYSWRAREAGWSIGVDGACVVRHDGSLPSTFRTRRDVSQLSAANHEILRSKWANAARR
jgi:GT2 family glycosyltransferase